MTKSEMTARYDAAMKDLSAQKMNQSAQAYAAGAAILLMHESELFHKLAKLLLLVLGLFAAFYMAQQV